MNKLKIPIFILIGVIIVLLLLFLMLQNILSLFSKDIDPVNDDDLSLKEVTVLQEENSYQDLIKARREIVLSDEEELINDHITGKTWDEDFVKEFLLRNEKVFYYFDEAVKKPKFQNPYFISPEDFSLFTTLEILFSQYFFDIISLKAIYLAKNGEGQEAMEEAFKLIKIGQVIQDSQAPFINYLSAIRIKHKSIDTIQKIIELTEFSSEELIQYAREIEKFRENKEWITISLKGQYSEVREIIDLFKSGDQRIVDFSEEPYFLRRGLKKSFYFHPNKTKKIFIERTRLQIEQSEKPCGLIEEIEIETFDTPTGIKAIFVENWVGKNIHDITSVTAPAIYKTSCEVDLYVSALQSLLAIKAYNIEHGKYPVYLEELVPIYIEKVPVDPFSGDDIKFSADKKIIYSIGNDLIDLGGSEGEDWKKMDNPTFQIDF